MRVQRIFAALLAASSLFLSSVHTVSAFPNTSAYVPFGSSGGTLVNGSALLPFKCDADSDNVTCHLVVDIGSGGGGGFLNVSGVYNTSLPTLTNGQSSQLQLDQYGRLQIAPFSLILASPLPITASSPIPIFAPSPLPVTVGNTVPVTLGSLPSLAAGAAAIGSITNTSFIATQATAANFNATVVFPSAQAVTGSGNFTVVQPTGTNLHAVLDTTSTTAVTQATASNLNATVVGVGTAGTPSGGVFTVQGSSSGTKLPVLESPATRFTPAPLATSSAYTTLSSSAITSTVISVTWSAPTTATTCYVTLYNSASPTVGSSFVDTPWPINVSAPGSFSIPIMPTIGISEPTALSVAVTTTPTGSTACNTTSNQMWVGGAHL